MPQESGGEGAVGSGSVLGDRAGCGRESDKSSGCGVDTAEPAGRNLTGRGAELHPKGIVAARIQKQQRYLRAPGHLFQNGIEIQSLEAKVERGLQFGRGRDQPIAPADFQRVPGVIEQARVRALRALAPPAHRPFQSAAVGIKDSFHLKTEPLERARNGSCIVLRIHKLRGVPVGRDADDERHAPLLRRCDARCGGQEREGAPHERADIPHDRDRSGMNVSSARVTLPTGPVSAARTATRQKPTGHLRQGPENLVGARPASPVAEATVGATPALGSAPSRKPHSASR